MNSCLCYIFLSFLSYTANYHPVHVSILNAEYTTGKSSMDLSFKVFTSDLELALAHNYSVAMNLGKSNENKDVISYINKYFSSGIFSITVNNNYKPKLVFYKKQINEDAIWLYFKVPLNGKIKELFITDVVLLDIYEDQTNLLIFAKDGKEMGYRFTINQRDAKIKI